MDFRIPGRASKNKFATKSNSVRKNGWGCNRRHTFRRFRNFSKNVKKTTPETIPTDFSCRLLPRTRAPGSLDSYASPEGHIKGAPAEPQKSSLRQKRIRFEIVAGAAAADTIFYDLETFRKPSKKSNLDTVPTDHPTNGSLDSWNPGFLDPQIPGSLDSRMLKNLVLDKMEIGSKKLLWLQPQTPFLTILIFFEKHRNP